jgi:hypothetical protein
MLTRAKLRLTETSREKGIRERSPFGISQGLLFLGGMGRDYVAAPGMTSMVGLQRSARSLETQYFQVMSPSAIARFCLPRLKPTPCINQSDRPTPANRLNPSTAPVPPDLPQLGRSLSLEGAIATIAQANAAPTELCYHFLRFEAETYILYGLDPVTTSTRTE